MCNFGHQAAATAGLDNRAIIDKVFGLYIVPGRTSLMVDPN